MAVMAALVMFVLALPQGVASASRPVTVAPCTVAGFDHAAGLSGTGGFTQVNCDDGWGLAVGPKGVNRTIGIFQHEKNGWTEVRAVTLQKWEPSAPQFAGLGIGRALLLRLAGPFPLPGPSWVGRGTYRPGWRWSEHGGPLHGRGSESHAGYVLSGSLVVRDCGGVEVVVRSGQAFYAAAGHDAWVIGEEPCEGLDFPVVQRPEHATRR